MTEKGRRHQLYGRRKGKTLRPHHASLIADLLPRLRFDPNSFDFSKRKIWLEIGFGGGEHLAHQAELNRDVSFIGVEPFVNGVAKLLAAIEAKQLGNAAIHDGDARDLLEKMPGGSLERIYLLYPDPWPKTRHHRRRLVNQETLRQFHRLLKPGGLFLFASDMAHYVAWTLFETRQQGGFAWTAESPEDWRRPFPDWIETRYEAKAKREGRAPTYLTFKRI